MTRYGDTPTVNGWTKTTTLTTDEDEWKQIWQEAAKSDKVDVPRVAAEFYLLEIISAHVGISTPGVGPASELPITPEEFFELLNIKNPTQRQSLLQSRIERLGDSGPEEDLTALRRCAIVSMAELVDAYMPTFYEYLNLAIGGEIRHHRAGREVLSSNRPIAWCDWQHVFEEHGVSAIQNAALLFREFPSNAGYGGEAWAQAAEILASFLDGRLGPDEATNRRLFMDRVWTLEHNNGCILNKVPWINLDHIQKVLNAHAANPPNLQALYKRAGRGVRDMWNQYIDVCNVLRDKDGEQPIEYDFTKTTYFGRCNYCASNVEAGHDFSCAARLFDEFNGGAFDANTASGWYSVWDDEMIEEQSVGEMFHRNADQLAITPQGTMEIDSNQKVRYKVTIIPYDGAGNYADSYGQYDTGYQFVTWGEMLTESISPASIIPSDAAPVEKMEFRLSVYAVDNDTNMDIYRIAKMYQYHPIMPVDVNEPVNLKDWMKHCYNDITIKAL